MQDIIYDIHSKSDLIIGYREENNARSVEFRGFTKDKTNSTVYLMIEDIGLIPLLDFCMPIEYSYTIKANKYRAILVEKNADDSFIKKSNIFSIVVKHSVLIGDIVAPEAAEFTNWFDNMSALYQTVQTKLRNGELKGEKGDAFKYSDFTTEQLEELKGEPGDNGTSPTANVVKTGNKSVITITDASGTTTAEVTDGAKGDPGETTYIENPYNDTDVKSRISAIENMEEGSVTKQLNDDLATKADASDVEEINDLVSDIIDKVSTTNIFDKSKRTQYAVLGSNGSTTVSGMYNTTDYIEVSKGDSIYFFASTGNIANWGNRIAIYDSSKNFVRYNAGGSASTDPTFHYDITDDNAKYIRVSYSADYDSKLCIYKMLIQSYHPYGEEIVISKKLASGLEVSYASLDSETKGKIAEPMTKVEELEEIIENLPIGGESGSFGKTKLCVETWSYFYMKKEASSFSQDNVFNVTGTKGSKTLNIVGTRSGSTLTSADINCGIVIKHSDSICRPYVLTGYTDSTITVYPSLYEDASSSILAPLLYDSQHLTRYGYLAYMQYIDSANPKHCEKNKYIDKMHPTGNSASVSKFSGMGLSKDVWLYSSTDSDLNKQYGGKGIIICAYADYATESKYGAKWKVSTGTHKGYLETFVGTRASQSANIEKDADYPMYIDVYADGELIYQKVKTTNIIERICVDYDDTQDEVELQVYYKKMRKNTDSIFIGETTFWINENYPSAIFPKYATISQLFDSWGEYHNDSTRVDVPATPWNTSASFGQGASGEELKRIMKAKSGYQTPVFNTSKSGETSRWGKSWFGVAVREKNPNVVITDFGINDYHTTVTPTGWDVSHDPYGNEIVISGNPLTISEYTENMKSIFDVAIMSNIQPVFIEGNVGSSLDWSLGLINGLAEKIGE